MKDRKLLTKDFILLSIPLAIGAAIVLPFVAYDFAKELLREKRNGN